MSVLELGMYQARPYGTGPDYTCWQLYRYDMGGQPVKSKPGQTTKAGWKALGVYPTTLEQATEYILEYTLRSDGETATIESFPKMLNRVSRQLKDSIRFIVIEGAEIPDEPPAMLRVRDACGKGRAE